MKILLTGLTGFIGGHLGRRLVQTREHQLVGLVRPQTDPARFAPFAADMRIIPLEFTDAAAVNRLFAQEQFDCVLHLAAIRGGGAATQAEFYRSNVQAPLTLARAALQQQARFVFCSSVGVFGTIPRDLPPTEQTPRHGDNYYHATKIEAEARLRSLAQQGLDLVIIRPIITYGEGDRGFPFVLMKLIDQGVLLLPTRDLQIHLVDVQTVVAAFVRAAICPAARGKVYTVTDKTPISLTALVDHFARQLHGRPYPTWKRVPTACLRLAEWGLAHVVSSEAWLTRVQLMSRDWYYDGSDAARDFQIDLPETIPHINRALAWYQQSL